MIGFAEFAPLLEELYELLSPDSILSSDLLSPSLVLRFMNSMVLFSKAVVGERFESLL